MATYVIDAYNVMFSTKEFSPFRSGDKWATSRRKFIRLVSEFAAKTEDKVIVVFDGKGQDGKKGNLEIIFADNKTADKKVAELWKNLPPDTVFVSSDKRGVLGRMRSEKAKFIGASKFIGILKKK